MADKVYQILDQRLIDGDVGIEIEVENVEYNAKDPRWKSDRDGSLRGANREFILRKPLPIDEVRDAVQSLANELKDHKLSFSFRTSVHVHVNVQEMTHAQVLNFVYLYLLLEEPLINYCGESRKGNRFCLRLADAEGLIDLITTMASRSGQQAYTAIPHNNYRYAAVNLEAIPKYGSVEFRGMRGTLDVDVIDTWCQTLYKLREVAKGFKNPKEVCQEVRDLGSRPFFKAVLEDLAKPYMYPKIANDLDKAFSLTLDVPYAYQYVEEVKKEGITAPRKRKKIGELEVFEGADVAVPENPIGEAMRQLRDENGNFVTRDALGRDVRVNDLVEVIAKYDNPHQFGWVNAPMDRALKQKAVVRELHGLGVYLEFQDDDLRVDLAGYGWPYRSLLIIRRGD